MLVRCRKCDHPFLVDIERCPLCGWENPGRSSERGGRLLALILCLLAVLLIAYLARNPTIFSNPDSDPQTTVSEPKVPGNPKKPPADPRF